METDGTLPISPAYGDDDVFDETLSEANSEDAPLEPRFKYERMDGTAAKQLYNNELFSAVDVHEKFIAIGTQSGKIYVMDHQGFADFENVPIMKPHRCPVSKLKIDKTGSYIISCANDGKVVISGIGSSGLCCTININYMPRSIAIEPDFVRSQYHSFILGERRLVLYEKKLFYKTTNVFSGAERDGFITCCSWENDYIAFTNDMGTQIYDRKTLKHLTSVQPSHDIDRVRSARSPPRHAWLPNKMLLVGWADTITTLKIGDRRGEVHNCFHVPLFVSGVTYTHNRSTSVFEIFITGLEIAGDELDDAASVYSACTTLTALESNVSTVLKTIVLRPLGYKEYELQSEDTLDNISLPNALPCNVHMAGIPSLHAYFLITLRDIIVVAPYGAIDGVRWRLKYHLWDQALEMARQNPKELESTDFSVKLVGRKVVEGFLKSDRPKAAAARLPLVCGESKEEWQWAVNLFETMRLCTLLAEVLPTVSPQLEPENYECVLQSALYNDVKLFRKLIQTWNPDLYRTGYIIVRTQYRIKEVSELEDKGAEDERILMESLAYLYLYVRKYENALKIYISCRDSQIFPVIEKYQLFDLVKDQISDLMAINSDLALRLLLDNADSVPAAFVMDKIARQPKLQMAYLSKLIARNEGNEYADKIVQLYAEYDRKKLLPFFKRNEHYHLNKALKVCQSKNYVEETIYLLARGGNQFDAVQLMVKSYDSIDKVIDYCKDQDDKDLWLHMVKVVVETPAHVGFLSKLLVEASSCLDPIIVLEKMPVDTDTPGIGDALSKVLLDVSNQLEIREGCYLSMLSDSEILIKGFLDVANSAVFVTQKTACSCCGMEVNNAEQKRGGKYHVYACGHTAHTDCCEEVQRRHLNDEGGCITCADRPIE
ncbi:unnamed protein product [Caenorhabditis bovis]|uniref:Vps41 beta-propeller domain-containing protein n=1 Tax=Caenorhabditis bovis TaxID=2654633 RepID=A0A8S1EIJ8_9PELO|nr:unnamed protein product [Caenorhabditis bovis]